MEHALIVSNVLLWIALLALAAVVVALLRQIGVLHERVTPAGALFGREGPLVGAPAPVLEVEDWRGRVIRVGGRSAEGASTLLFFLSPTCPVCKALLPVLRSLRAAEKGRLRIVFASDGPRAEHEAFVREHGLEDETYVLSSALGLVWQVGRLPTAALVDETGTLRARGLVNTREHLESLFEARERGVASLQEWMRERAGARRVA